MAYRGLVMPVIAKRTISESGVTYTDGIILGRAVKISMKPVYEDVSEYEDINETEEKSKLAYTDITLDLSELSLSAENIIFGHDLSEDTIVSRDTDEAANVGFGIRSSEIVKGDRKYIALWFPKVNFSEDDHEHNTRKEDTEYDTPSVSGKALPDENGIWRIKKIFITSKEADSWLKKMAGIQE